MTTRYRCFSGGRHNLEQVPYEECFETQEEAIVAFVNTLPQFHNSAELVKTETGLEVQAPNSVLSIILRVANHGHKCTGGRFYDMVTLGYYCKSRGIAYRQKKKDKKPHLPK